MEKLNVCLLNDSFPPTIDGVANAVFNYASVIQKNYGNVSVVTPSYPKVRDDYPFKVFRYPSSGITKKLGYRAGFPYCPDTYTKVCEENIDIIHSHCPAVSNMVGRMLRELTGVPMVFTYHTKFDYEIDKIIKLKPVRKPIFDILVENISAADEVWTVSEGAGKNLRSLGYKGDCRVMPNGVDMPRGRCSDESAARIKAERAIPENVPVFLFVGRVTWYKGMKISLDALREYQTAGNDYRMVIVGNGLDLEAIKKYTQEIGIADKCIFTGPIYDRAALKEYFSMADLFLFPSVFDTNGLVVREAAASGLASVLIKDSCAAEGVGDGRNGFLIEENSESMAKLLFKVGGNRKLLRDVGRCAMEELYFSWEDSVSAAYHRYEQIYENCKSRNMRRRYTPQDEVCKIIGKFYTERKKLRELEFPDAFSFGIKK